MSGPYCKDCKHFARLPLTPEIQGECRDPSKIIYSAAGNNMTEPPEVFDKFTCSNWEGLTGNT